MEIHNMMTVAELIEELQKHPPEAHVKIGDYDRRVGAVLTSKEIDRVHHTGGIYVGIFHDVHR